MDSVWFLISCKYPVHSTVKRFNFDYLFWNDRYIHKHLAKLNKSFSALKCKTLYLGAKMYNINEYRHYTTDRAR